MNTPEHIIVVEDDSSLAQWIADYLQMHNFAVTVVNRGDLAVDAVRQHQPDLILLDIMLPFKDGFEICKEVRRFCRCPILMMTACDEEANELLSLELGADDYINKPVKPQVLLARIRALLRRAGQHTDTDELSFGELVLKKASRAIWYRQQPVQVSSNEFDLLWLLASQPGQVVSRSTLVSQLRGFDYDGLDRSIDIRISRIRKKLEDTPEQPTKIKTIWGKGYIFVSDAW